ncbi:MAG: AraC family transcriptional regulator [Pseudomonadota bacterium]
MSLSERVAWQVERRLYHPLSIRLLAKRCATSPYHMTRVFRLATGLTPMTYVRARRLSEAAKRLASGTDDILNVALDAQFGSHEAFTRAFAGYFGVLPRKVREARSTDNLDLMEPLKMKKDLIVDVKSPEIRTRHGFRVIGMSINCSYDQISAIPPLWQTFAARYAELDGIVDGTTYGVSCDADDKGNFRYVAGVEAGPNMAVPKSMDSVDIPDSRYAVFTHKGHVSDLPKTIYTIWNKALSDEALEPKMTADFELYDQRFDAATGQGVIEIWVPVA